MVQRFVPLLAIVAAAAGSPSPAAAAACWQRLLEDYVDGRIDGSYSLACYRQALKSLPEDLRIYGSAESDLANAMQETARTLQSAAPRPRSTRAAAATPAKAETPPATARAIAPPARPAATEEPGATPHGRRSDLDGSVVSAAPADTAAQDARPTPIVLLGAFALLLIATAGVRLALRVGRRRP